MKRLLIAVIDLYQWALRPVLAPSCRFFPSCSDYARQALEMNGPLRGSLLALGRLLRCHPFHPGGNDPVPQRISRCGTRPFASAQGPTPNG